jgi:UDP-GlcNAc:undecaprenyl-phosphate GlcNAc-1-phosphate transferase
MPWTQHIIGILIGGAVLVATGILDDRYDISPYLRFFLNFIAAGCAILSGLGIPYISNPFGDPISLLHPQLTIWLGGEPRILLLLADGLAIVWLMALMNIVNWSKGVDGQLPGYTSIAALFMGIVAYRFSHHDITASHTQILAFAVAGSFAGFLPWNFYPQRIMPGYGGGSLAGYLLGVLSILSFGKVGALMIVLAIPILDGIYTILRRILTGHNPFRGDAHHLHHLLLRAGWSRQKISIFYMLSTALLGAIMLFLPGTLAKCIFISIIYIIFAWWIYRLSRNDTHS